MLNFYVPPGIGDFSAMYCKLCNLDREMRIISSSESPQRLIPFLEILPNVKQSNYGPHGADASVNGTLSPGTDLASLPDGDYFLSINHWLEGGGKVKDWIPGETNYHYEMNNFQYAMQARRFLDSLETGAAIVGVYCSAFGNSRHWGFWDYTLWRKFLEKVITVLPDNTHFLLIGAEYDLSISDTLHGWMQSIGKSSHLLLGEFHIGGTIELIRQMDYLFSFPSGLGFLADVVNTPHTMWFPGNLAPMMGTFTDPENYESQRSYHATFNNPDGAFEQFKAVGLKFVEEACRSHS